MGDRTSVAFSIGGTIRAADVETLAEAIENEGFGLEYGYLHSAQELTAAILENSGERFTVYDEQCNYADTDDLRHVCETLGLTWRSSWDAGGGYGAGVATWNGTNKTYSSAENGDPLLDYVTFKTLPTHEAVAAWFAAQDFTPPPLEVIL